MKSGSCFQLLCSTLIGLAGVSATTSVTQAADIGAPVLEVWHARTASAQPPAVIPAEAASTGSKATMKSRGAEGPLRMDEVGDRKEGKVDNDMVRRDLQMNRYPISNGVSIP